MRDAQSWTEAVRARWVAHTERGRQDADRAVTRRVIDPDAPIGPDATARLEELRSRRYRAGLARAVRRNTELGATRSRLAPPVARLLAQDADQAVRIAAGLEQPDPDLRAVIETERQLEAGIPSAERLTWIARVLDLSRSPGTDCLA